MESNLAAQLGHEIVGDGPARVVVLNDWLCDTSTWDHARAYLDRERFSWVFTDLRGYGRSRARTGRFDLREAVADVLELVDSLGFERFALVGHSMSSLVALHLAQHHAGRLSRVVVVTPPPPAGFGSSDAMLEASRGLAMGDDDARLAALGQRFGTRLSPGWTAFKAARWRATAEPRAASEYVAMFARDGLPDRTKRIDVPLLAITGEHDFEPMRSAAVTASLSPLAAHLTVVPFADAGHYPMQEMPPRFVAEVERFLTGA
jgi:pimeloyl-ACP methyl ester carboxylesterase